MSESQGRHAAPAADSAAKPASDAGRGPQGNPKAMRSVRFWAVPVVITLAVLATLSYFYLGGILNPTKNLKHFPIAIVNEDAGPTGAVLAKGMVSTFDNERDSYDVRVLGHDEAERQLDNAQIYGVALIPPNFSSTLQSYAKKLQDYAKGTVDPGRLEHPVIRVIANPRAGALGASIAEQRLGRAATIVDRLMGERLSQEVAHQGGDKPVRAAVTMMLAHPIEVGPNVHNPLPEQDPTGSSPFYFALLLLLAGFIGSFVVSTMVDSMLGFVPAEFGPVYRFAQQVKISRFRTLLVKWAFMVLLALLSSSIFLTIAGQIGVPIQNKLPLWLYGLFAIGAVGITSTSLIAVLGAAGLLISLLIFVLLGLPSAGATIPSQAAPQFFGWLANVDPIHQVYLGMRALLLLGGRADAGLSQSLITIAVWLVIGLLLGGIVTWLYERREHQGSPALATKLAKKPSEKPSKASAAPKPSAAAKDSTDETEAADATDTPEPAASDEATTESTSPPE